MSEAQLSLWDEPIDWLNEFEARLRKLRLLKLFWWTNSLRDILDDILNRRDDTYKQLMLLETEIERGADQTEVLERIAKLKGLVTVVCFGLLTFVALNGDDLLRRGNRKRQDDIALIEDADTSIML